MNLKTGLGKLGILTSRAIWPVKGSRGLRRIGLLIAGSVLLIGITQAAALQKLLSNVTGIGASIEAPTSVVTASPSARSVQTTVTAAAENRPGKKGVVSSPLVNIVDLIDESELILKGMTKEVTDGFENGVPYTEVKILVSEALRGNVGEEYTFRQFGLTQPRKMENGKVNLNVTPDGWARYAVGEGGSAFPLYSGTTDRPADNRRARPGQVDGQRRQYHERVCEHRAL